MFAPAFTHSPVDVLGEERAGVRKLRWQSATTAAAKANTIADHGEEFGGGRIEDKEVGVAVRCIENETKESAGLGMSRS